MEASIIDFLLGLVGLGIIAALGFCWKRAGDALDKADSAETKADSAHTLIGKIDLKLQFSEQTMQAVQAKMSSFESAAAKISERLATLEAYGKSQNTSLRRIEAHLIRSQGQDNSDEDSDH